MRRPGQAEAPAEPGPPPRRTFDPSGRELNRSCQPCQTGDFATPAKLVNHLGFAHYRDRLVSLYGEGRGVLALPGRRGVWVRQVQVQAHDLGPRGHADGAAGAGGGLCCCASRWQIPAEEDRRRRRRRRRRGSSSESLADADAPSGVEGDFALIPR